MSRKQSFWTLDRYRHMLRTTRTAYNHNAHHYHQKMQDPRASFWNTFIERPAMHEELRKLAKGKRVLDLGCGSGLLVKILEKYGATSISGVDFSKSLINIAQHENPKVDFYVADIQNLPLADETFDLVVSSLVFHYIRDLNPVFSEVSRVLYKNGHFLFTCLHPNYEGFQIAPQDGSYPHRIMQKIETAIFKHTIESMTRMCSKYHFNILTVKSLRPIKSGVQVDLKEFQHTMVKDTFLMIKAFKR